MSDIYRIRISETEGPADMRYMATWPVRAHIDTFDVRPQRALMRMGFDTSKPQRGTITVQIAACKFKNYSFRYRVGDGHVITRIGRVLAARKAAELGTERERYIFVTEGAVRAADMARESYDRKYGAGDSAP